MAPMIDRLVKVIRWDNELCLRIPKEAIDQLRLKEGDVVRIQVSDDSIVIRRAKPRKRWTEAELLEGITPELCGPELIPGRAGGELI